MTDRDVSEAMSSISVSESDPEAVARAAREAAKSRAAAMRAQRDWLAHRPETQPTDPPPASPPARRYHPFIEGLLRTLPPTGQAWPLHERVKWFLVAANVFDLIYESGGGEISVSVAPTLAAPSPPSPPTTPR